MVDSKPKNGGDLWVGSRYEGDLWVGLKHEGHIVGASGFDA